MLLSNLDNAITVTIITVIEINTLCLKKCANFGKLLFQ